MKKNLSCYKDSFLTVQDYVSVKIQELQKIFAVYIDQLLLANI